MAKRRGRAVERSRRRKVQRSAARPTPTVAPSAAPGPLKAEAMPSPAVPLPPSPIRPPRPGGMPLGTGSRLSERAAAEYHYVLRDLRNIGVLIGAMAVLLAGAAVAFNLLGIGPR